MKPDDEIEFEIWIESMLRKIAFNLEPVNTGPFMTPCVHEIYDCALCMDWSPEKTPDENGIGGLGCNNCRFEYFGMCSFGDTLRRIGTKHETGFLKSISVPFGERN